MFYCKFGVFESKICAMRVFNLIIIVLIVYNSAEAAYNSIYTVIVKSGLNKTVFLLISTSLLLTDCGELKSLKNANNNFSIPKRIEFFCNKIQEDEVSKEYIEEKGKIVVSNFDKKGRLIDKLSIKSDGTSRNNGWKYEYNKAGNLKTESLFNLNDSIISQISYKYNEDGKVVEQLRNFYGKEKKIFYNYDSDGNLTEEILKYPDGTIENITVYKHDDRGNKIESSGTSSRTNITYRIERQYNEQNQEIKQIWNYSHGMFIMVYDKQYNEHGDMVLQEKYKVTGSDTTMVTITKEELNYDDKKNRIYCKTYVDGIPFMVTKSKIEYWD